jgi:hypothetical protein
MVNHQPANQSIPPTAGPDIPCLQQVSVSFSMAILSVFYSR